MKQYLLPQNGNFYKTCLHCHSTFSDGKYTPQQLKDHYMKNGYSIIAYTDHNVLVDHSYLNDDKFLALTGYEANLPGKQKPACTHLCFYAKDPHNVKLPCYNPRYVLVPSKEQGLDISQQYVGTPDYERTAAKRNDFIKETCENGFLCCYNHPTWSLENLDDYRDIEGIFAMEIYNYHSFVLGANDVNDHAYDDLLRLGKKIYCLATDDSHATRPVDHPKFDCCGGYVYIKAEKLEYSSIINALENGDFYSSTGPQIYEMYAEDGLLHIKTSPVERITLSTFGRFARLGLGEKMGDLITEATLELPEEKDKYFRLTLDDGKGKFAWTNAYFGIYSTKE